MSYRNQYAPLDKRFWEKVDASGDCWIWIGERQRAGYGLFRLGNTAEGKRPRVGAHRWVWEHLVGPIPDGYTIDHLCKNHPCVNPDHLEPVPHSINLRRGNSIQGRNARMVECQRGHWFSPANTIKKSDGARACRACENLGKKRRRLARKLAA